MELYSTTPYGDYLTPSSTGGKPFTIYHFDVASFYPSIIGVHKVAPSHIDTNAFCNLISWMKQKRVDVKHSEEEYIDGIAKDILALVLKIVINSIYGKLGFEKEIYMTVLLFLKLLLMDNLCFLCYARLLN